MRIDLPSRTPVATGLAAWTLLAVAAAFSTAAAAPPRLYVATKGNDAWSGTLPEPNAAGTDGPLATLEAARDAIRQVKRQGALAEGVAVEIGAGLYQRERPFELTADDSGAEGAPIVYRARKGGEVRLVGGRSVTGFEPVVDPAVVARLDEAARGKVLQADLKALGIDDFGPVQGGGLELFFQDKPMTVARWPNEGFVKIVDLVGGKPVDVRGTKGDRIGKFMYEGDRPRRWKEENDAWVHGYWFWDWSDQRHKVESIDLERRILSVAPPYHGYGYRKGQWFYAFNLLAEIDQPGEWYLDRSSGILYFWPPEPIERGEALVSMLDTLVTMEGVAHVALEGMTFEAARGTAVTIRDGTAVRVAGCTLRNLGRAVQISGGTGCGVEDCTIYQLADGGVALSGGDRKTLTPAGHFAVNNHIHDYGRWNRMYRPAVAIHGVGNRAAHNLIHDAPHQAISFGGNDHVIELNEMHHVCLESNDAGAIYSGRDWTMRGTVIRHNFMHHVTGFENRGCVGVYLDDMFCGTAIYGNVFYRVTRAAFVGGGRDCTIENNVFVDCKPAVHVDARAMGWASGSVATTMTQRLKAMPYQSPPWRERYPELINILDDEPAAPKGNLVARNISFGGTWDGVHSAARPYVTFRDNLVDHDPGFVDAPNMNFQLRDDSPVYRLVPGFQKIPFDRMGRRPR